MSAVVQTIAGMSGTGHYLLDLQDASLHRVLKATLLKNLGLLWAAAEEQRVTQRRSRLKKAW
jgi:hypothetical protein